MLFSFEGCQQFFGILEGYFLFLQHAQDGEPLFIRRSGWIFNRTLWGKIPIPTTNPHIDLSAMGTNLGCARLGFRPAQGSLHAATCAFSMVTGSLNAQLGSFHGSLHTTVDSLGEIGRERRDGGYAPGTKVIHADAKISSKFPGIRLGGHQEVIAGGQVHFGDILCCLSNDEIIGGRIAGKIHPRDIDVYILCLGANQMQFKIHLRRQTDDNIVAGCCNVCLTGEWLDIESYISTRIDIDTTAHIAEVEIRADALESDIAVHIADRCIAPDRFDGARTVCHPQGEIT